LLMQLLTTMRWFTGFPSYWDAAFKGYLR
jgi:hypothetical protein